MRWNGCAPERQGGMMCHWIRDGVRAIRERPCYPKTGPSQFGRELNWSLRWRR